MNPVVRCSLLAALLVALAVPSPARAFCGFYVKDRDVENVKSRVSRAVLLRDGTTTVLSIQPSYEGPPEDFALIVPVPSPIGPEDVKVLEPEAFDRLDALTAPRLVEYWEQEPVCLSALGAGGIGALGYGSIGRVGPVTIEAAFAVGEYDVVVLGASESQGLVQWLGEQGYRLPPGAEEVLRPYVQRGMRFFAARVDASRVRFEGGRAMLSPLRIRTDSDSLSLPIRLGTLASPGAQDLLIHVISRDGRYEVANRENVRVPTNLEVRASTKGRFGSFYESLVDHVFEERPGSVLTEYAWSATTCDPCPGPTMSPDDITTFGGDLVSGAVVQSVGAEAVTVGKVEVYEGPVLPAARIENALRARSVELLECVESPARLGVTLVVDEEGQGRVTLGGANAAVRACAGRALEGLRMSRQGIHAGMVRAKTELVLSRSLRRYQPDARGFTLTRLRARYGRDAPDDLVFRQAPPIVGGLGEPDGAGQLQRGARPGPVNSFQARYAILHRWTGDRCEGASFSGWGGPPDGEAEEVGGASVLRSLRRRAIDYRRLLRSPLPALEARRAMPAGGDGPLAFLRSTLLPLRPSG